MHVITHTRDSTRLLDFNEGGAGIPIVGSYRVGADQGGKETEKEIAMTGRARGY